MSSSNAAQVPPLRFSQAPPHPQQRVVLQQPRAPSFRHSLILVLGSLFVAIFLKFSLHSVPEGHVGVYWRGGKLLPHIKGPGLRLKLPILDVYSPIQVTLQTDKVTDIPCGTKGGVMVYFEKVEVVNRLRRAHVLDTIKEYGENYDHIWIYSKIHHEMNQLCSKSSLQEIYIDKFDQIDEILQSALQVDCTKFAPGIEIMSVRVTKPRLPAAIVANFEAMEAERTRVGVARERALVIQQEAQTEHQRAVMMTETEAERSRIHMQQLLAEREAEQKQEAIQNEIFTARQRSMADAEHYRMTREAEAMKAKLTPEYLQLAFMQAVANNTKLYFGEKLPSMLLDLHRILPAMQGQGGAA